MGRSKKCCHHTVRISERDINRASQKGVNGYVISKPGKYELCEDVNWNVRTPNSFAITIAANNVSLDLRGHFIKQVDTTQANNFAIQIAQNVESVLVHNGTFQQLSSGAVLIQPGAHCITLDKLNCHRCAYNGVTTLATPVLPGFDAFSSVILFNGSSTNLIENVVITNCTFCDTGILGTAPVSFLGTISGTTLTLSAPPLYPLTPGFVLSGASITGAPTLVSGSGTVYTISSVQTVVLPEAITVTDPNGAFVPFGRVFSIFTNFTNNVKVDNVVVNGNFGYALSWALTFATGSAIVVSNFQINDVVTFGLGKGIEVAFCQDILIQDGAINNILMNVIPESLAFPLGHGAEGTKIGFSEDWTMRRVAFAGNVVQTQVPTDFSSLPLGYLDCAGLMVDSVFGIPVQNGLVEDCSVQGLQNDGGQIATNASLTAGFNISTSLGGGATVENIHLVDCTVSDLSGSVGWVYGFGGNPEPKFNSNPRDITFTDCTAQDIEVTGDGVYAAGYVLTNTRFNVTKCTANRITGDAAYGIVLDRLPTSEANGCILDKNRLTNCDTNAIVDKTVAKDSVITRNYAALSGPAGTGPNYAGLNPFVPIALWKPHLASPAPATPSNLVNFDIQN